MIKKEVQIEIQQKLLKKKEQIRKILGSFATKDEVIKDDFHSDFPDIGSENEENALEVSMYSDRISLEAALEKILKDIDGALNRIDENTYGICKYCKKEILQARLLARPVSTSCVACKEALQEPKQ